MSEDGYTLYRDDDDALDLIADANEAELAGRWNEAERLAEKASIHWTEALEALYGRLP